MSGQRLPSFLYISLFVETTLFFKLGLTKGIVLLKILEIYLSQAYNIFRGVSCPGVRTIPKSQSIPSPLT